MLNIPVGKGFADIKIVWQKLGQLLAMLALIPVLTSCSAPNRPDLERLYAAGRSASGQPPVILVHGTLGAKLRDRQTLEEYWPSGLTRLLFSNYENLALEIDPQTLEPEPDSLEAYAITDKAVGRDFYGRIIETLAGPGGYDPGHLGTPPGHSGRQYYVFHYDWRQDNVISAQKLAEVIEQIRIDYSDPDLQVDIVAHSMGGLITRYYLRYGTLDTLDDNDFPVSGYGAQRVRRVVLLGTPSLGSAGAIHAMIEGMPVGLASIPAEVIATMPSTYQLLPHALNAWLINIQGEPLERDLFDSELWRRFEWGIYHPEVKQRIIANAANPDAGQRYYATLDRYFDKRLERARRFVWSLTVPAGEMARKLIVLGGDCDLTPARVLVEEIDGDSVLRLWPKEIHHKQAGVDYDALMLEPGDGVVTKASLLARENLDPSVPRHPYSSFPLDFAFFLCHSHDSLTGNVHFQDNLLNALLSRDE